MGSSDLTNASDQIWQHSCLQYIIAEIIYINTVFLLGRANIDCWQILQDKHSNWMQDKTP